MWTDFSNSNAKAMLEARVQMNDYRLIRFTETSPLTPEDTVLLHAEFVAKLNAWFAQDLKGARVVITHHAPAVNPNTKYGNSPLMPAFNSLDMLSIIERHQPKLWVYGHTHECDNQYKGKTQIISNQLGYPSHSSGFECKGFDPAGLPITV
jgi:Icc-related predicted phosphoesterase